MARLNVLEISWRLKIFSQREFPHLLSPCSWVLRVELACSILNELDVEIVSLAVQGSVPLSSRFDMSILDDSKYPSPELPFALSMEPPPNEALPPKPV